MIELDDDPWEYEIEYDPDDYRPFKEEPDCCGCNDSGWRRPWGYRRILARTLPLCVVWGKWRGLLVPWGTLGGSWPCDGCNPCWIDTWWLTGLTRRLRWWRFRHRWGRPKGAYYDDEPPF